MQRRAHPSEIQLEILLKFLEHQPSLAKGFLKHTAAREHAHIEWSKLASKLNSVSGGCVKSPKRWMKYWSDKKSAVKKKAAIRTGLRGQTGGGISEIMQLTKLEERILTLTDPTSSSSGSIRIFTPSHSIAPVSLIEPNTISNISPKIQETPTIAENIDDSTIYTLINSDVETSKYPEQPQSSSDVSIPSRVRRRFRLQPSPPSQHRNYLNSITEKLLRIEEQRLDLDKKLLDLLNQQSINNNLLIQTVNHGQQAISESQKAMAEALTAIAIAINK
ncbi:uncharacterized protein LOC125058473 isoform X1 [Pieris napi]|uniref:uncharacterized protein LOC125058473 isoform X1 n=2 Tax=Pieris napi TaxID=78633 RepID=UPI001FBAAB39|nr:uncharacterized protein LOC125058473 isoform X1 [Pieris napi]XP_047518520.1 uncharacterized protein LOC125058473 isoform X1 [Pieris napi]XP_047518521.1 uncharacterized protein LOC125058473 isoform X1 [Pieris napi]